LNGVSRVLRQRSPHTRIIVAEPDNSAILASGVAQARNADGSHSASHPAFRPHPMQGWSPDFIPKLAEQVQSEQRIDDFMSINGNDALRFARELATQEGIFVGISAGATLAGALQVARTAPAGSNILCMLPDTGERYLSTPLFDGVAVEMTDEEQALSKSTGGYRFDAAPAPAPAPVPTAAVPADDPIAVADVDLLLEDKQQPLVMFALEWCEFCWSAKKAFAEYGIEFRGVDLDSVAYQEANRGGRMREVLRHRTGSQTLPQIFVGGEFVGGATEVFDRLKTGELGPLLQRHGIGFDTTVRTDPYSFLPRWLHSRQAA
jgi:cysteine synthase A